jgi:hypothetical protein
VSRNRAWSDAPAFHRLVPTPSAGTLIRDLPSGLSAPDRFIGRQGYSRPPPGRPILQHL